MPDENTPPIAPGGGTAPEGTSECRECHRATPHSEAHHQVEEDLFPIGGPLDPCNSAMLSSLRRLKGAKIGTTDMLLPVVDRLIDEVVRLRHAAKQDSPAIHESVMCLVCAREKPWGTWSPKGVAVCIDCRNAAREDPEDVENRIREKVVQELMAADFWQAAGWLEDRRVNGEAEVTPLASGGGTHCGVVCQAAKVDGITCADGECDRANGMLPGVAAYAKLIESTRTPPASAPGGEGEEFDCPSCGTFGVGRHECTIVPAHGDLVRELARLELAIGKPLRMLRAAVSAAVRRAAEQGRREAEAGLVARIQALDGRAIDRFWAVYHDVHNPGASHVRMAILAALADDEGRGK